MAGENNFLKLNNGLELRFSNFKEIKEEDLKDADMETKRLFNIFAGDDHILQANEAQNLWNKLQIASTTNKNGDNSIFDNEEMQTFLENNPDIKTRTAGRNLGLNNLNELLSNIFVKPNNNKSTNNLTPEQRTNACQTTAIKIINDNIIDAKTICSSQYLGDISGFYDDMKDDDNKLKTSNVQKVLDYQTAGTVQLYEAQEGRLTRRAYYEENKQRLKDMMLSRLLVLKTPSGDNFLDSLRGKYTRDQLIEIVDKYIDSLCKDISMEQLKGIQKNFVTYSNAEELQAFDDFIKNAIKHSETVIDSTLDIEDKGGLLEAPRQESYWDSDEIMSFEEVYKLERGTEFSQEKVEKYVLAKKEMEIVANAYNKKQQFVETAQAILSDKTLTADTLLQKITELYSEFYAICDDNGMAELKKVVDSSNSLIKFDENGIDLSAYKNNEEMMRTALNLLLLKAISQKEADFQKFLGGKTIEDYQQSFEQASMDILGEDNALMLAEAMKQDNTTAIQRYTGNVSMAGMALTVVGGILCFTPAAPLGATMVTVGNAAAITGMAGKTGLQAIDYATNNHQSAEEWESLAKDFILDASGFIIGIGAGKAGMKAFNKLIDKKLSAVFAREISAGNRMQALQTVLKNPEYLKNFMTAGGAKISSDFLISYVGDLAMMGLLDTDDDWKSLLQANLTGILVGMSGDIKDVTGASHKTNRVKPNNETTIETNPTQHNLETSALGKNDTEIITINDVEVDIEVKAELDIEGVTSLNELVKLNILKGIENKYNDANISDVISDIEASIGEINDPKIADLISNKFKHLLNDEVSIDEAYKTLDEISKIIDIYHTANGDSVAYISTGYKNPDEGYVVVVDGTEYIGEIWGGGSKNEAIKFLEYLKQENPELAQKLTKNPSLIEKYLKRPEYANLRQDFNMNLKYEALINFLKYEDMSKVEGGKDLANYFYNEYYLKEIDFPQDIKTRCAEINNKYGVKIILSAELTSRKDADKYFDTIEKELNEWMTASNGKAKLPPVINFLTTNTSFKDSYASNSEYRVGGYSENANGGSITTNLAEFDTQDHFFNILRHEMTHTNDTKQLAEFPEGFCSLNDDGSVNLSQCKFADELERAGVIGIEYAYTNPQEFIARAAEGDMSKYSPEMKAFLVEMGMPEWMFEMKQLDNRVAENVKYAEEHPHITKQNQETDVEEFMTIEDVEVEVEVEYDTNPDLIDVDPQRTGNKTVNNADNMSNSSNSEMRLHTAELAELKTIKTNLTTLTSQLNKIPEKTSAERYLGFEEYGLCKDFTPEELEKIGNVFDGAYDSPWQYETNSFIMLALGEKPGLFATDCSRLLGKDLIGKMQKNGFDTITVKNMDTMFIINKELVQNTISENKEFFTKRLGLNDEISVDEIYNHLISEEGPLAMKQNEFNDITGIVLGYPKTSSMIFELKSLAQSKNLDFNDRNVWINLLYSEDSPYKNMSPEFKQNLEEQIKSNYDISSQDLLDDSSSVYPFRCFADEPEEILRIGTNIENATKKLEQIENKKAENNTFTFSNLIENKFKTLKDKIGFNK